MDVDLIFKLAALGILVSVLNLLLAKSGRDDYGLIVTLAGLLVSLLVIVNKVNELFETIRVLFEF
ncbi:MAG: stage III sporulation protein AC [Oscillospiraceae bacterium]|nr:stage III sporulation protein AC [Oscillospiraceae bacterium]